MLGSFLFAAYLLAASFSLYTLAVLLYFQDRHSSELRWAAMIMFLAGATSLVLASLLWLEVRPNAKTAAPALTPAYTVRAEQDLGENQ